MVDGVEDPQAGVGAVAAHDDDLHQSGFVQGVEPQKGLHQGEGGTLGQDIPLVADLVVLVCGESLGLEDAVLSLQVKERPGADADDQGIFQIIGHKSTSRIFYHYTMAPAAV